MKVIECKLYEEEVTKEDIEFELNEIIKYCIKNYTNMLKQQNNNNLIKDQYWNLITLPNGSTWRLEDIIDKFNKNEISIKLTI